MLNYIILGIVAVAIIAVIVVLFIYGKITKQNVLEWLLYAVTEAEKQLGSETGALKLHLTYDWFIAKYPVISKFISFEVFSVWVDLALVKMKELLENEKIANYVEGTEK